MMRMVLAWMREIRGGASHGSGTPLEVCSEKNLKNDHHTLITKKTMEEVQPMRKVRTKLPSIIRVIVGCFGRYL